MYLIIYSLFTRVCILVFGDGDRGCGGGGYGDDGRHGGGHGNGRDYRGGLSAGVIVPTAGRDRLTAAGNTRRTAATTRIRG